MDSVDHTKDDNDTTNSTDTISHLTHDLVFLRKDSNESIKIINDKWDVENATLLHKIFSLKN